MRDLGKRPPEWCCSPCTSSSGFTACQPPADACTDTCIYARNPRCKRTHTDTHVHVPHRRACTGPRTHAHARSHTHTPIWLDTRTHTFTRSRNVPKSTHAVHGGKATSERRQERRLRRGTGGTRRTRLLAQRCTHGSTVEERLHDSLRQHRTKALHDVREQREGACLGTQHTRAHAIRAHASLRTHVDVARVSEIHEAHRARWRLRGSCTPLGGAGGLAPHPSLRLRAAFSQLQLAGARAAGSAADGHTRARSRGNRFQAGCFFFPSQPHLPAVPGVARSSRC